MTQYEPATLFEDLLYQVVVIATTFNPEFVYRLHRINWSWSRPWPPRGPPIETLGIVWQNESVDHRADLGPDDRDEAVGLQKAKLQVLIAQLHIERLRLKLDLLDVDLRV